MSLTGLEKLVLPRFSIDEYFTAEYYIVLAGEHLEKGEVQEAKQHLLEGVETAELLGDIGAAGKLHKMAQEIEKLAKEVESF